MSASPVSPTSSPDDRRLRRLALVLELQKQARHARSTAELGFVMVNETHNLAPYRQAVFWANDESGGKVQAMSGLAAPDRNAPYVIWVSRLMQSVKLSDGTEPVQVKQDLVADSLRADWAEWLPEQALLVPVPSPAGGLAGSLLLCRDEPWSKADAVILANLADAYGHAWHSLTGKAAWIDRILARRKRLALISASVAMLGLLIPVRHSALAPAEVVAANPALVRTSVEGVVDSVLVQPNEIVKAGQPLLRLDDARIANRLEVAVKAHQVADAELRQASQQALFDAQSKAALAILRGRLEEHTAEVSYYRQLLDRIEIRAPRDGVAVFDNVQDLLGRPVALGERIMLVADPNDAEVEVQLPVADAIALKHGAAVRVFLNIDAYHPLAATLTQLGYQALPNPAGGYSYRLVAALDNKEDPPRIGLRGVAKVYGERTILGVYLLRRPLSALRQLLGL